MKFLSFTTYHIDKLAEIAKAIDKLASNPPEGYKVLSVYSCQANPFPGVELPPGTMVGVSVLECDNAEALASAALEMQLAGGTVNRIPVLEVSTGVAEETVERLKV